MQRSIPHKRAFGSRFQDSVPWLEVALGETSGHPFSARSSALDVDSVPRSLEIKGCGVDGHTRPMDIVGGRSKGPTPTPQAASIGPTEAPNRPAIL